MDALMEKQRRKQLASLPFSEKIEILENLRRVTESAGKSGLRKRNKEKPARGNGGALK
jgi:hypothetical protein